MEVADFANAFIADAAPWTIAKDPARGAELQDVCSLAINLFRLLAGYLKPIIPATASRAEAFLAAPIADFADLAEPLLDHVIKPYEPLLTRIDPKHIEAMTEASKENLGATPSPQPSPAKGGGSQAEASAVPVADARTTTSVPAGNSPSPISTIPNSPFTMHAPVTIDDFAKLDLRIGTVLECGFIDGSDKLLRFLLDAGELGQRQIFSGIRAAYAEPEKLIGRKVVFIANLAPRKMRFGVSEGMILSAGSGGDDLHLLDVDDGAQAGMPVK